MQIHYSVGSQSVLSFCHQNKNDYTFKILINSLNPFPHVPIQSVPSLSSVIEVIVELWFRKRQSGIHKNHLFDPEVFLMNEKIFLYTNVSLSGRIYLCYRKLFLSIAFHLFLHKVRLFHRQKGKLNL